MCERDGGGDKLSEPGAEAKHPNTKPRWAVYSVIAPVVFSSRCSPVKGLVTVIFGRATLK